MKVLIFFALLSCGVLAKKDFKVWTAGDRPSELLECFSQNFVAKVLKNNVNKEITITGKRPRSQKCLQGKYTVCVSEFASFINLNDEEPEVKLSLTSKGAELKIKSKSGRFNGILTVCDKTRYTGLRIIHQDIKIEPLTLH